MKKRELGDYIQDILEALGEVEDFTTGMQFEDFVEDKKTINAVVRSLEVIGEAAKKMPDSMREKYPEIPWKLTMDEVELTEPGQTQLGAVFFAERE